MSMSDFPKELMFDKNGEHFYPEALQKFLNTGIDEKIANVLACGAGEFHLISNELSDPTRIKATEIHNRLVEKEYWNHEHPNVEELF